jgi:RNA polymerase sigma-70 factor (ECF subfamily)
MVDETQAVILCQEGDREAFRSIVERYGDTLYGTAFLMTRDHATAEDMAQQALIRAWKSIPQFTAGTNLKAWLVRILVNQVVSDRRRKRLPQESLDAAFEHAGEEPGGLESLLELERQEEVRAALFSIDESSRRAIVLRYFAEMTVPEIAESLGWAEGTVKSRIHRGLRKMREHFTSEPQPKPAALKESC